MDLHLGHIVDIYSVFERDNYICLHETLEGKTPETTKIKNKGTDKWKELIKSKN